MAKFKIGEIVLYKGEEHKVKVHQKDFLTKRIVYVLDGVGEKIPESLLKPLENTSKEDKENEKLYEERKKQLKPYWNYLSTSEKEMDFATFDEDDFEAMLDELKEVDKQKQKEMDEEVKSSKRTKKPKK